MWSSQKLYKLRHSEDPDVIRHAWGFSSAEVASRTEYLKFNIVSITKFKPGEETIKHSIDAEVKHLLK